jgi:hypothetical protein
MIYNFKKHSVLMGVVLVLLFLGLLFFVKNAGSSQGAGAATGGPAIKLNDRTFLQSEVDRLGKNSMGLAARMRLTDLLDQLGGSFYAPDANLFFANRMILRDAMQSYGIYPNDAAINTFIRERSVFTSADGTFQAEAFSNLVDSIGRMGMSEGDIRSLVSDYLGAEQLARLVGGGLLPDLQATSRMFDADRQEVTVAIATLSTEEFKKSLNPTEDEVKEFWEKSKKSYLTEREIKVSYLIAGEALPPAAPAATAGEKKEIDPARRAADMKLSQEVDNLLAELGTTNGKNFEELAKKQGWQLQSTEFFNRTQLPVALDLKARNDRTTADFLFAITKTSDPLSVFSDPIPVGESQWLLARLDDSKPVREMTFEEAKTAARNNLIEKQAASGMLKRAAELQVELATKVAAKTPFAEAAKALSLEVKTFGPFRRNQPPVDAPASDRLFEAVQDLTPGSMADLIELDGQAVLVFLQSREAERLANADAQLNSTAERLANFHERSAMQAWLTQRRAAGNYTVLQPN